MPLYSFECQVCQKIFEEILSLEEMEKGEMTCPECDSKDVRQTLGGGSYSIQVGMGDYRGKVK
jgi:putative FmdB family regulatory protein